MLHVLRADAHAGIRDLDKGGRVVAADADLNLASGRGELEGVGEQVVQHLLEPRAVGAQHRLPGGLEPERDAPLVGCGARRLEAFLREGYE